MTIFKPYSNIKDFLSRFTLLKIGKLHIRLHKITDSDQTEFYHNHPFNYLSIVLWGGYSEVYIKKGKKKYRHNSFMSFIFRNHKTYHRIEDIHFKNNITLFFAYGNYNWKMKNENSPRKPNGIFPRTINGKTKFYKRENDIYFIGHDTIEKANEETRHSIHQVDYDN